MALHLQLRFCISLVLLTTITLVSNAQNVGIGTTNPQTKLDVNGSFRLKNGTEGSGKILRSDTSGVASWGKLQLGDVLDSALEADFTCMNQTGQVSAGANTDPLALAVSGNYAYVAIGNLSSFVVADISNPMAPVLVNTGVSVGTSVNDLAVSGNYLYLAVTSGNGLMVYDISNPSAPVLKPNTVSVSFPVCVKIAGNYAYLKEYSSFKIINISNPAAPVLLGSVAINNLSTGNTQQSLAISGNYAYLANSGSSTFQIVNNSNPNAPVIMSTLSLTDATAVTVAGNYACVIQGTSQLKIIDISNPASPVVLNTITTAANPGSAQNAGNYLYVQCGGSSTLQVYNISTPALPTLVKTFTTGTNGRALQIKGNYGYLLAGSLPGSIQILKLTCSQLLSFNNAGGLAVASPENWERLDSNLVNLNGGNIGIGTSNPQKKLDVNGAIRATAFQLPTGAALTKVLVSDNSGNASWGFESDPKIGSMTQNGVPHWTGSVLTYGTIFDNGTNVGIGISGPPSQKLEVNGVTKTTGLQIAANAGAGKVLQSDANGFATWVSSLSIPVTESDPKVGTLSTNLIPKWNGTTLTDGIITDNGNNIGIGTTSPLAKLDINGSLRLADGSQGDGKILKSDVNGIASWGKVDLTDLLDSVAAPDLSCMSLISTTSTGGGSGPQGIFVSGNYAYEINAGAGNLKIFDLSNPAAPVLTGTVSAGAGTSLLDLAIAGNYAYVTDNGTTKRLLVFDISNPAAPALAGSLVLGGAISLAVSGNYTYVRGSSTLYIINISNPSAPVQVATITTGIGSSVNYRSLVTVGNYVFLANSVAQNIQVFNISNPAVPVLTATLGAGTNVYSLAAHGNYLYASLQTARLRVVDVTNPQTPVFAGNVFTGTQSNSLSIAGNMVYGLIRSAGTTDTLYACNVSDPSSPIIAAKIPTGNNSASVYVTGNAAYVTNGLGNNFQVFRLACLQHISFNVGGGATNQIPENWERLGDNIANTNAGNIGIGTINPQEKLDVSGNLKITGAATITGNTGIGTTSPQSRLHVVNSAVAGAAYYINARMMLENNGQNYVQLINNAGSSSGIISGTDLSSWRSGISFNADSSVWISSGGAASRVVVDNTGFIGVNLQSPSSYMDVLGSLGAQITTSISSKTMTASDFTHIILNTTNPVTITLPAAATCPRRMYVVVNRDGNSQTISSYLPVSGGAATTVIAAGTTLTLQSDGSNWYQIR